MSIFARYMKVNSRFFVKKLDASSIELVRTWRNQDFVRNQMEFQQMISIEDQEKWFNSIKDDSRFEYYLFGEENTPVGLVHLANINFESKTAEVGLFIGESSFIGTGIPFRASYFILHRAFSELYLDSVLAKVNKENKPAIEYNISLGFEWEKEMNASFDCYCFTSNKYKVFSEKWSFLFKNL